MIFLDVRNGKIVTFHYNNESIHVHTQRIACVAISYREAWHDLGDLTRQKAMEQYISIVNQVDPGWDNNPLDQSTFRTDEEKRYHV